jgi:hypothetical protein
MKTLIAFALVIAAVGVVSAQDLGARAPIKAPQAYPENLPDPLRQGGDTIATATYIPALPYYDSGTTTGYVDNYDAVCPYTGATAPDVVYKYVAAATGPIDIDLCGSTYDTKLYVYDAALNEIACNDDFYFGDPCGIYVSRLESVALNAGAIYYIVVDGYGAASGAYALAVLDWCCFCPVDCPAGGQPEGEPPLFDDYVDNHDGGCNTSPDFPFATVAGDEVGEAILCGVSGWYHVQGANVRDTDWYILSAGAGGTIPITCETEYNTYLFELGPQDCASVGVVQQLTVANCEEGHLTIGGYEPGAPVWFWVGPTVFVSPSGGVEEFNYAVWFSGLASAVASEATTWSRVKVLYD